MYLFHFVESTSALYWLSRKDREAVELDGSSLVSGKTGGSSQSVISKEKSGLSESGDAGGAIENGGADTSIMVVSCYGNFLVVLRNSCWGADGGRQKLI